MRWSHLNLSQIYTVLPALFATELQDGLTDLSKGLNSAWDKTCETYREGCNILGSCIAEYDPREGIILAENGSKDLVSGTTASVVAMDFRSDEITVLNCGDSRTIILTDVPAKPNTIFYRPSHVHFATRDHSPSDENEIMRLRAGKDNGFDYAEPECSLSRHYLTVGDYQYAVSRSLEGTLATSKGVISDADVTKLNISQIVPEVPDGTGTVNGAIVIGTDGLFDVMSDEEVAGQIVNMMKTGVPADDASKELYHRALKKGSSDNISIIVIYFSL
jgi:serine/threonine protein phosphatase PrpC